MLEVLRLRSKNALITARSLSSDEHINGLRGLAYLHFWTLLARRSKNHKLGLATLSSGQTSTKSFPESG